jgi:hypothetical protein
MQLHQLINRSLSLLDSGSSNLVTLCSINNVFKDQHKVIIMCVKPHMQAPW